MKFFWIIVLLSVLFTSCKESEDRSFLVSKIRSASKLATTEVVLTKVVSGKINDRNPLSYANPDVIFNSEATVKIGVDLSKISHKDIYTKDDSIHITLPAVEIINFSYPHEKFDQLYPVSNIDKIVNRDKIEILDDFFRQAETDIRGKIRLLGLREEAEKRTREFLELFLQKYKYDNVVIEFKSDSKI